MNDEPLERVASALERISLVLAAMYAHQLGEVDQGQKANRLSQLGFANVQIAELLGSTANSINVALHKERKRRRATK